MRNQVDGIQCIGIGLEQPDSAGLDLLILILVVAILGKLAGGTAGALIAGQPWRASMTIGSLLNARGLTELIAPQSDPVGARLHVPATQGSSKSTS